MGPRIMLRRFVILPLCLTFGIGLASAEAQETMAPDRPGIGSGSHVLSAGTVQLEVGVAFTSAGLFDSYGLGQTLLRFGLPGLEVQALLNSVVVQRSPGGDAEGVEDLGIGVKARLLEQPDDGLAVSALAAITAPTGAAFVSNDEWVPSAALLADLNLTDRLGVSANLGYQVGRWLDRRCIFGRSDTGNIVTGSRRYRGVFRLCRFLCRSGQRALARGRDHTPRLPQSPVRCERRGRNGE